MSSDSGGSRFAWSSLVLAAEARKAESASVAAERIPRPPSFTGREACSHLVSRLIVPRSRCLTVHFLAVSQTWPDWDSQRKGLCALYRVALGRLIHFAARLERHVSEALIVSLQLIPGLPPSYLAPCRWHARVSEMILYSSVASSSGVSLKP